MTLISTFSGAYCNIDPVLDALSKRTRYRKIFDADIIAEAQRAFDTPKAKLEMAFSSDHSAFNRFTHEREYCIAQIKYAVARQVLEADGLLIHGFAGQLISQKNRPQPQGVFDCGHEVSGRESRGRKKCLTKTSAGDDCPQ
jgi:hypothetical protein